MPSLLVHASSHVAGAGDLLSYLRPGQHPVSAIAEPPVAELRLALDPSHVALARGREEIAGPPVAGNAVAGDALGDDPLRLFAQRPERAGAQGAEGAFEHTHRLAQAAADLPAVAPARSPSDPGRLQHDDRIPPLGEMQGGGDPGEPGADDADVGRLAARECAMAVDGRGGGRVPGIGGLHDGGHLVVPDPGARIDARRPPECRPPMRRLPRRGRSGSRPRKRRARGRRPSAPCPGAPPRRSSALRHGIAIARLRRLMRTGRDRGGGPRARRPHRRLSIPGLDSQGGYP